MLLVFEALARRFFRSIDEFSCEGEDAGFATTGGACTVPAGNSTLGQMLKPLDIYATARIAAPFGCSGFAPYEKRPKPC